GDQIHDDRQRASVIDEVVHTHHMAMVDLREQLSLLDESTYDVTATAELRMQDLDRHRGLSAILAAPDDPGPSSAQLLQGDVVAADVQHECRLPSGRLKSCRTACLCSRRRMMSRSKRS